MIAVSGSPNFIYNCSVMRHFHTENVTTKHEPIFIGLWLVFFCSDTTFLTFFGIYATNDTSLGRYGAERGNEGEPQPFRNREGVIY